MWAARDGLPLEALRAYRECAVASRRSVDEELQSLEYDAIASWHAEALAGAAHARHEPGFTPARPAARGCGAYGAYEYAAAAELKDGTTWRVVLLAVTLVVARRLAARFFTVWRWVEAQREALLLAGGDAGGVATKLRESLAVELTGERADDEAAYSRAIGELQCDAEGVMVVDAQSECEAKLRELRTELGERWATHRSALRHLDARIVMQRTAEEAAGQAALAPFCLLCGDSVGEGGGGAEPVRRVPSSGVLWCDVPSHCVESGAQGGVYRARSSNIEQNIPDYLGRATQASRVSTARPLAGSTAVLSVYP